MANSNYFKFKNQPNTIIEKHKEWIKENSRLARLKPEELDDFNIEVFGYDNEKVAKDLYEALESSGFLTKYPLFRIRIDPMQ